MTAKRGRKRKQDTAATKADADQSEARSESATDRTAKQSATPKDGRKKIRVKKEVKQSSPEPARRSKRQVTKVTYGGMEEAGSDDDEKARQSTSSRERVTLLTKKGIIEAFSSSKSPNLSVRLCGDWARENGLSGMEASGTRLSSDDFLPITVQSIGVSEKSKRSPSPSLLEPGCSLSLSSAATPQTDAVYRPLLSPLYTVVLPNTVSSAREEGSSFVLVVGVEASPGQPRGAIEGEGGEGAEGEGEGEGEGGWAFELLRVAAEGSVEVVSSGAFAESVVGCPSLVRVLDFATIDWKGGSVGAFAGRGVLMAMGKGEHLSVGVLSFQETEQKQQRSDGPLRLEGAWVTLWRGRMSSQVTAMELKVFQLSDEEDRGSNGGQEQSRSRTFSVSEVWLAVGTVEGRVCLYSLAFPETTSGFSALSVTMRCSFFAHDSAVTAVSVLGVDYETLGQLSQEKDNEERKELFDEESEGMKARALLSAASVEGTWKAFVALSRNPQLVRSSTITKCLVRTAKLTTHRRYPYVCFASDSGLLKAMSLTFRPSLSSVKPFPIMDADIIGNLGIIGGTWSDGSAVFAACARGGVRGMVSRAVVTATESVSATEEPSVSSQGKVAGTPNVRGRDTAINVVFYPLSPEHVDGVLLSQKGKQAVKQTKTFDQDRIEPPTAELLRKHRVIAAAGATPSCLRLGAYDGRVMGVWLMSGGIVRIADVTSLASK